MREPERVQFEEDDIFRVGFRRQNIEERGIGSMHELKPMRVKAELQTSLLQLPAPQIEVGRGLVYLFDCIYRLALYPAPDRPDLVLWSLWSRNRKEEVDGVYSHQTALSLYELSDLNPAKLHMTVPTNFRRNSDIPGIVVLHYRDLLKSEIQAGSGYKYTRPLRTILDLIETGTVERTFIRQALRQAVDRGLITRKQIRNAELSETARKMVEDALQRAA